MYCCSAEHCLQKAYSQTYAAQATLFLQVPHEWMLQLLLLLLLPCNLSAVAQAWQRASLLSYMINCFTLLCCTTIPS
jgi:hypothetical protein